MVKVADKHKFSAQIARAVGTSCGKHTHGAAKALGAPSHKRARGYFMPVKPQQLALPLPTCAHMTCTFHWNIKSCKIKSIRSGSKYAAHHNMTTSVALKC